MKIVAVAVKGQEFLYNPKTAHKVSAKSAERITENLNENLFRLKENEIWYLYDVDRYDRAFDYAESQSFVIRNGYLYEKTANVW